MRLNLRGVVLNVCSFMQHWEYGFASALLAKDFQSAPVIMIIITPNSINSRSHSSSNAIGKNSWYMFFVASLPPVYVENVVSCICDITHWKLGFRSTKQIEFALAISGFWWGGLSIMFVHKLVDTAQGLLQDSFSKFHCAPVSNTKAEVVE